MTRSYLKFIEHSDLRKFHFDFSGLFILPQVVRLLESNFYPQLFFYVALLFVTQIRAGKTNPEYSFMSALGELSVPASALF